MEFKYIQDYLDKYVKSFLPFKNDKPYQGIINVLRNEFFPEIYQNIPNKLINYVENQKINSDLYNVLLMGIGYPESLVMTLRQTQKLKIIQKLMDYHQYVSTPKYITKICKCFEEGFNIYELYADVPVL